jgi:bifunctional DNA-binding transcriptional regulator/antitoxin component of YhaV-PrlF toxin-antitoxin module
MKTCAVFRSGNTVRATIPADIRHALELSPGQHLLWTHTRPGVVEVRNADALVTAALAAAKPA